ncbi:MAG: type IV pilus assembly protein PilM [Candidatus Pacebacteria bacterium]|nr:type IV pilus assembly protein PilM [Candidatus Paceibacterota bacterium]
MFGLSFRPKNFLGIDIGSSAIRIIEMGMKGSVPKLENYGELDMSVVKSDSSEKTGLKEEKDTILLSEKDTAVIIKAILKEARISTKEVNFCIPDFSSFFTSFEIPTMKEEEIAEAIRYEVRPYIPLPLSEITLDWLITEGEPGRTPLKVLVVAIPNKVIDQYQEIAELSNLRLKALEPEVFALARALVPENGDKIIAIIDIGARSTICSIVDKGVIKTSHSFNIGGNELTDKLARSLNIDYNKAEELKKKYGLSSAGGDEGNDDIRKVLIPLIDLVLDEIKKAFRNFYQNEGKEVEKIILTGGLAHMPSLREYFSQELKKGIEISNPFTTISYPAVLKDLLEKRGPSYAVAVGLVLKGLKTK